MNNSPQVYSLSDINHIIFNGFNYELNKTIVDTISLLSSKVGSPSYIKTPTFQKKENNVTNNNQEDLSNKKKKKKNNEITNDDEWFRQPSFKPTTIEQKQGIDARFDIIRSHLNKMSTKNYIDSKNNILNEIDQIIEESNEDSVIINENLNKIGTQIFQIASTNRFYSQVYADLYAELILKYECMRQIFELSFDKFISLFDNVKYCDPEEDYDEFCKNNKDNEKRKALSSFFVNLTKKNIIEKNTLINVLSNLLSQFNDLINQENKQHEIDELSENINILYNLELLNNCNISNIQENIKQIATYKIKNFKSLTNKSVFKFMDM
jgi:hypothetical protein